MSMQRVKLLNIGDVIYSKTQHCWWVSPPGSLQPNEVCVEFKGDQRWLVVDYNESENRFLLYNLSNDLEGLFGSDTIYRNFIL